MPRFYLDLHECGAVYVDEHGKEFAGLDEARAVAIEAARDILSHEIKSGALCLSCFISVVTSTREELTRVQFRDAVALSGL